MSDELQSKPASILPQRKRFLLAAIAALALIYTVQLVVSRPDSVKILSLEDTIDTIEIERAGMDTLTLTLNNTEWTVGTERYSADKSKVDAMLSLLKSIKILGMVTANPDSGDYGLEESAAIRVSGYVKGTKVRTLAIGKNAVSAMQTYAQLDGEKAVALLSGNFRDSFAVALDDLRSKNVWSVDTASLSSVTVSGPNGAFGIVRQGDPAAWVLSGTNAATVLDAEKTNAWVTSLVNLQAASFAGAESPRSAKPLGTATLRTATGELQLTIHEKTADNTYLCTANAVSWPFYLSAWAAERFIKPVKELTQ